jgi:dTDP-4-amino-4,6-dideoxygalactose transaminase
VLIEFATLDTDRATVMRKLSARGIETQVQHIPVHTQSYSRERYGVRASPGVGRYYERVLSLPLSATMHDDDVGCAVTSLFECLRP